MCQLGFTWTHRLWSALIASEPFIYRVSRVIRGGAPGGIRTHDRRIRNPLLYPTELRVLALVRRKVQWAMPMRNTKGVVL